MTIFRLRFIELDQRHNEGLKEFAVLNKAEDEYSKNFADSQEKNPTEYAIAP